MALNNLDTVPQLINELTVGLQEEGYDLGPADVGRIVGLFFLKLAANPPHQEADEALRVVGQACMQVTNE